MTNMAIVGVTAAAVEADSLPPAVTSFSVCFFCIRGVSMDEWADGWMDVDIAAA